MRPSKLFIQLALVWVLIGLVCACAQMFQWTAAPVLNLLFWFYCTIIGLVAVLDVLSIRKKPKFKVSRKLETHLALGVRQKVSFRLSNLSSRQQFLTVTDFPSTKVYAEGLPIDLRIAPGAFAEVEYSVTPIERGLAKFGQICCRISSRWYLWEKKYFYADPQQSKIFPNYKPLFRSSFINSDQLYAELGIQLRPRRGEGTDFHQLREFRVGDSMRQIDWRATARFQKPISHYQEERDQQVVFLLDCGRRMRAKDGDISHFDHALNALLISAFVAMRQGDSVGLLSFAGQSRWVSPIKGAFQISHLLEQIYDLECSPSASDYLEAAEQLITRQSRRSLIIMITSLEPQDRDDLSKAAKLLSKHHLVMIASMRQQVLSETLSSEIHNLDDALKLCGVSQYLEEQGAMYAQLRGDNIIVADTKPALMHSTLINEYMALKRSGAF